MPSEDTYQTVEEFILTSCSSLLAFTCILAEAGLTISNSEFLFESVRVSNISDILLSEDYQLN